jgi:hypothetical protein
MPFVALAKKQLLFVPSVPLGEKTLRRQKKNPLEVTHFFLPDYCKSV